MRGARSNGKVTGVGFGEDCETGTFLNDAKGCMPSPHAGAGVPAMRHNRKLGFRVAGIGKSVYVEPFGKYFGSDEQSHGAENAAVVREVAGAPAWEHVKVEGVIHTHEEGIGGSCVDEMRNVESEGGVAFACVFTGEFAVHPNRGGVEYGSKLDANGGAGPSFANVEIALVPGNAAILDE